MGSHNQQAETYPAYQHKDEIKTAYEEIKKRNSELKEIIDYLEKENHQYKQQYNDQKGRITNLNGYLEKSAKLFVELLDNTNSALQIGRLPLIHSPISQLNPASLRSTSPQPGTSRRASRDVVPQNVGNDEVANGAGTRRNKQRLQVSPLEEVIKSPKGKSPAVTRHITRRKFTVKPLNMQQLRDMAEEKEEEEAETEASENNSAEQSRFLSTIFEEDLSQTTRELCVRLTRLSQDAVASRSRNGKIPLCNNSSFNISDSLISNRPECTSTPTKVDAMLLLGLTPVARDDLKIPNQSIQYITTRKRRCSPIKNSTNTNASSGNDSLITSDGSPQKKQDSSPDKNLLPPRTKRTLRGSNKKSSPARVVKKSLKAVQTPETSANKTPELSKRPSRTARPKDLKEESLRKKLRRD